MALNLSLAVGIFLHLYSTLPAGLLSIFQFIPTIRAVRSNLSFVVCSRVIYTFSLEIRYDP